MNFHIVDTSTYVTSCEIFGHAGSRTSQLTVQKCLYMVEEKKAMGLTVPGLGQSQAISNTQLLQKVFKLTLFKLILFKLILQVSDRTS